MSAWSNFWNSVWNGINAVGKSGYSVNTTGTGSFNYRTQNEIRNKNVQKEREKLEKLKKENKIKKDTNVISPKDYYKGKDTFQKAGKDSKIRQLWTDEERAALSNLTTDDQMNVIAKAKQLALLLNEAKGIVSLSENEKDQLLKEYKEGIKLPSQEEYIKQRAKKDDIKVNDLSTAQINKYKEDYAEEEKKQKELNVFGVPAINANQHLMDKIAYGQELTNTVLQQFVNGQFTQDQEQLKKIEYTLDKEYENFIQAGKDEADAMGYKMTKNEAVAHYRYKQTNSKDYAFGYYDQVGLEAEAGNKTAFDETSNDISVYTNMRNHKQQTYEYAQEQLKKEEGYNSEALINSHLSRLSGGQWQEVEQDDGTKTYKFVGDTDVYGGVGKFNYYRDRGLLDTLLKDSNEMEKVFLTYEAMVREEGQAAADQWLEDRLQSEASNNMGFWDYTGNAVCGFGEDIVADAAEVVGAAWGLPSGLVTGIGSLIEGEDFGDALADAVGQAFDNNLTRWGHDLSQTGAWVHQKEALEKDINFNDDIVDPNKADAFMAKYGGSGWGGVISTTTRQASHTMFSVWAGKGLGTLGAKVGTRLFGLGAKGINAGMKAASITRWAPLSITKAMMKGRRAGTTFGIALAGANEGIADGLDVRDGIYERAKNALDEKYAKEAIAEVLNQYAIQGELQTAMFLDANGIGKVKQTDEEGNDVLDENGNPVMTSGLLQKVQTEGGFETVPTTRMDEMVAMFMNSDLGKQAIEKYKNRPEIKEKIEQEERSILNSAIYGGGITAAVENSINGSLRNGYKTARANAKAMEKQMRALRNSVRVTGGKVIVDPASIKTIYKAKAHDIVSEMKEEALQNITSETAQNSMLNHINNQINGTYDFDSWQGFMDVLATDFVDIVENAGASAFSKETAEAAIQGGVGAMMGYINFKNNRNKNALNPLRYLGWQGNVFQYRDELTEENRRRDELREALQEAIDAKGGVKALTSIMQTKESLDSYNRALQAGKTDVAGEIAIESLIKSASTLQYIKDTEYGRMLMKHIDLNADLLDDEMGTDVVNSDELLKARKEKARQLLTSTDGELSEKQKQAITEVQNYLAETGSQKRTVEQIAQNPSDEELMALIDIVDTAKQTKEFLEKVQKNTENNKNVLAGVDFTVQNLFNVKTVLLEDQKKRMKELESKVRRIAEESGSQPTPFATEQKRSIAIHGQKDRQKAIENEDTYIKEKEEDLKKWDKELAKRKKDALAKPKNSQERVQAMQMLAIERSIYEEERKELRKRKERLADTRNTRLDNIDAQNQVLSAYDILSLSVEDREFMLSKDRDKEGRYSNQQNKQIKEARRLLRENDEAKARGEQGVLTQMSVLQSEIQKNEEVVGDILENPDKFNQLVAEGQQQLRMSVLNYRYQKDMIKDLTADEVYNFVDKLDADVKEGLISKEEADMIKQNAMRKEQERIQEASLNDSSPDLNMGWSKWQEIEGQDAEIGRTIDNSSIYIDKKQYDQFFKFLKEKHLLLSEFNNLDDESKRQLLLNSETLKLEEDDTQKIKDYIQFAAETQNNYKTMKEKIEKVNDLPPIGKVDNTDQPEDAPQVDVGEEAAAYQEAKDIQSKNILQNRIKIDGNGFIGSAINRFIRYLSNESIINSNEYGPMAQEAIQTLQDIGMSSDKISNFEQLYDLVEATFGNDKKKINQWREATRVVEQKRKKDNAQRSQHYSDQMMQEAAGGKAHSRIMSTQKISEMRADHTKAPLIDFLEAYNYKQVARRISNNRAARGLSQQIYYVTDKDVTERYAAMLGNRYDASKHLPVFTCVDVGEDYQGPSIEIQVGDKTMKVAPIGVINESIEANANANGQVHTIMIRDLANDQQRDGGKQQAIKAADGTVLESYPKNFQNFIKLQGDDGYTGRRKITDVLTKVGDTLEEKIDYIIGKLRVEKADTKDHDVVKFDNEFGIKDNQRLVPMISADMTELKAGNTPIVEILQQNSAQSINNPIILMFYNQFTNPDNPSSIVNLLNNKDDILNLSKDLKGLEKLNNEVNRVLRMHFFPGGYNGSQQWKYAIKVNKGTITLNLVPDTKRDKERDDKTIMLLNLTNHYDANGELVLKDEDVNTVLQNMIFDDDMKPRLRKSGATFCTTQISFSLVNQANGDFSYIDKERADNDEPPLSDEQKAEMQERARSVLAAKIRGGGVLTESIIDADVESLEIAKPNEVRLTATSTTQPLTPEASGTFTKLNKLGGNKNIGTNILKAQQLIRDEYKKLKTYINGLMGQSSQGNRDRISVTTLTQLMTGEDKSGSFEEGAQKGNQIGTVGSNIGTNTDAIFRHFIWSTRGTKDQVENLKKIPTNGETGDKYYTDEELEKEFGFKASQVKNLASRFEQFIIQRELSKWHFYPDVIRPKTTIELTDNKGNKHKIPISGELDMIAVDDQGKLHLIDFKTVRIENKLIQEDLRTSDKLHRQEIIKNKWQNSEFGDELAGYRAQLNLYAIALQQQGFNVAGLEILAVPVTYQTPRTNTEDRSRIDVRETTDTESREYKNSTLEYIDPEDLVLNPNFDSSKEPSVDNPKYIPKEGAQYKPFQEGLGMYEFTTTADGRELLPLELTPINVGLKDKVTFDLKDLLALGEEALDVFLKNNPELFDLVEELRQQQKLEKEQQNLADQPVKKAKKQIIVKAEIKDSGTPTQQKREIDGELDASVGKKKRRKSKSNTQQSEAIPEAKLAHSDATYSNINSLIALAKEDDGYNDAITFIDSKGETHTFTSEQMERYKADYESRHGENVENEWDNTSIDELCDDMHCFFSQK